MQKNNIIEWNTESWNNDQKSRSIITTTAESNIWDTLETKELKEQEDNLLLSIFNILEKSGYDEHSPMHMEMYMGNSISIAFCCWSIPTAKNNYTSACSLLNELPIIELVEDNEGETKFITKSWKNIEISYNEWDTSVFLDWDFTDKAIKITQNEYNRFDQSRERYEEKEKKEW